MIFFPVVVAAVHPATPPAPPPPHISSGDCLREAVWDKSLRIAQRTLVIRGGSIPYVYEDRGDIPLQSWLQKTLKGKKTRCIILVPSAGSISAQVMAVWSE